MNLSNARATFGLQAKVTPTSSNSSGSIQIGANSETISFPTADVVYSLRAIFAGSSDELAIDLTDCDTTGSTAFVAGNAQVEIATITAAAGATSSGTMTLVLASAGMTGSPLNIAVPLITGTHTTAALIAAAARNALLANAVVVARFTISGTGPNIVLTRKPTSSYAVPTGILNLYAANDTTLNLAIPSGLGVTAAATSANTTAGVISDGVKIYDGDGKDFEGETLAAIAATYGVMIKNSEGPLFNITGSTSDSFTLAADSIILFAGSSSNQIDSQLIFLSSGAADLTITVIGQSA